MYRVINKDELPDGRLKEYLTESKHAVLLVGFDCNVYVRPNRILYLGRYYNYGVRPVVPDEMSDGLEQLHLYHLGYENDTREADLVITNDGTALEQHECGEESYGVI